MYDSIEDKLATIRFTKNWNNKLNAQYFTTIRKAKDYFKVGHCYRIICPGITPFVVRIHDKTTRTFNKIGDFTLLTDTGMDRPTSYILFNSMYPGFDVDGELFDVLLLERVQ
jgi:hypothetical protein